MEESRAAASQPRYNVLCGFVRSSIGKAERIKLIIGGLSRGRNRRHSILGSTDGRCRLRYPATLPISHFIVVIVILSLGECRTSERFINHLDWEQLSSGTLLYLGFLKKNSVVFVVAFRVGFVG